jgi:hypothetical protein
MTPSPLRLLALTLLAVCLGFFTPILISFLFLVWFDAYWRRHEVEAHLSAAMPSPAEAALEDAPLPPAFQRWMDGR